MRAADSSVFECGWIVAYECVRANKAKYSPFRRQSKQHLATFFQFVFFYSLFNSVCLCLLLLVCCYLKYYLWFSKIIIISVSRQKENGLVVCQFCRDILQISPTICLSIASE